MWLSKSRALVLLATALVMCLVLYSASSFVQQRVGRVKESHAAARARRALLASSASAAARSWFPPALDSALALCIRKQAPVYRAHLEAAFEERLGYLGGTFCNQCDREVVRTWASIARHNPALQPAVILDIGANIGKFASTFLEGFPAPTRLHSFELDPSTFGQLQNTWRSQPEFQDRWTLTNAGVAAEEGKRTFFSGGAGSGLSSLGPLVSDSNTLVLSEEQNITTVPAIMERLGLDYVDFLKIDVEGWEREVILGMQLDGAGAGKVGGMMFETGSSWLDSRKGPSNLSLAELVDFLSGVPPFGFACFFIGRDDLLPISPPWTATQEVDMDYGLNVLCLKRDTQLHASLLESHRKHIDHCLMGQGLYPAQG
jgi:FkbM family methyltransferase